MKTNCHIECVADPEMLSDASWVGSGGSGTDVVANGVLTLASHDGRVVTAAMGYAIDALGAGIKELYHWEIHVDSVTLGGGTLTVTAGGETLMAITAAGKFSGTIEPNNDSTALKITSATAAVNAVISRCSLVKYGNGMNARA